MGEAFTRRGLQYACTGLLVLLAAWLSKINPTIEPNYYRYPEEPPRLEGPLLPNNRLQAVTRLHEGVLLGPESFAADAEGYLYTGSADGRIWRIDTTDDSIQLVTRVGIESSQCRSYDLEPVCGRAKGMGIHPHDRKLYYLDTYTGLHRYDLDTKQKEHISRESDGVAFKFVNGLAISSSGLIYFTDSSSKWNRRDYPYEVLELNRLGRIMEYDPATNSTRTLLRQLQLANGLSLSRDQKSLLVTEMSACRITRFYLEGPKAGQSEIWIDNLPGYPDNIRLTPRGTYYVGLASTRFQGASVIGSFLDITAPYPWIRTLVAKVTPYSLYNLFLPNHAILLEIDEDGQIIQSYHDPEGHVITSGLSEAFEHEGHVYIGHFSTPFLGKIPTWKLRQ